MRIGLTITDMISAKQNRGKAPAGEVRAPENLQRDGGLLTLMWNYQGEFSWIEHTQKKEIPVDCL